MNRRILLYKILLVAGLVTLLWTSGTAGQVRSRLAYADLVPQATNAGDPARPGALARFAVADRAVPDGATILIGDSNVTVAPWPSSCFVNRGIGGERSDQLLINIRDWHSLDRAALVVVAIGTNDVWQWRAEGLEQRAAAIVREIKAPMMLLGVSARLRGVGAANAALRRACTGHCRFIEPISDIGPDGIHLSRRGYDMLARQLNLRCQLAHSSKSNGPPSE